MADVTLGELREECGVFGIYGDPEAAYRTYFGLSALQHRGQEAWGIVAANGPELHLEKAAGERLRVLQRV